jgi:hypothetical protein
MGFTLSRMQAEQSLGKEEIDLNGPPQGEQGTM